MRAFVFDTETTGFPVRDGTMDQQPYIVQFAGILGEVSREEGFVELDRVDIMIKPRIAIPFSASQIHGIYDRDVEQSPYLEEVIDTMLKYLNTSDAVVGHNVEFDEEIVRLNLERIGRKGDYQPMKTICTMRTTTDFCQLQGRGFGYKPPKLNELYKHLFGDWFEGAHNAMVDVEATAKAFSELVKKGIIQLEENTVMRLF